ncbi:TPA: polysaccharide biosynthesis protein [Clostridium botulinum]|uniref:polysaccharide biosynthesis protein n=1 Tax=Clostridium TaxID=1485 RepID=UPI000773AA31|nr:MULTISPECIES: nucleoside-diphosphate sugar epimerase/dehydratase [Clostridium]AUM96482.1 nucleoside-diphosphate sugar epimerase [Clostridium sporogenes]AVQ53934.1 polysaccharide biosynthesis protein [Clostridium botulinum]HBJ2614901.1 polysaccharide biosynthesis protein [Clostridium botulinum]
MRNFKKYILTFVDVVLINLTYILAYSLRFNFSIPAHELGIFKNNAIIITIVYLVVFSAFKLYKNLWSYASIEEFMLVVNACILSNLLAIAYSFILSSRIPLSINILAGIITILLIGGFRMSFRIIARYSDGKSKVSKDRAKRVMIIGAGSAGTIIVKEMKLCSEVNYLPVVFIDDDKNKIGTYISGVKVMGTRDSIEEIAKNLSVDEILIAIASIDSKNKKEIIDICKETGCKVKLMPGIYELIDGRVSLNKIREVNFEDLLGREPVKLDMKAISDYIKGRTVMVTGGGGSIGSELCRQIIKFKPKELIVLDNYENNTYVLQQEFKRNGVTANIKYVIASVRDKHRLDLIFKRYIPEIVFHAAAHKHVPLMEENPSEAIKNNVFGTLNVVTCADKYKVKRFVMISTDKAVNPTNIMGATKRVCEMIIQSMDKRSKTQFVAVRFGNVLGSNGSVVPLFIEQIKNGGPLTVTHKDINRFFMTIPEAAQLVLQAGVFAKGGEIFVLDMDKPVKIYDLACDLIRLSGYVPNKDIKIKFIGLRPGEKLYEEVLTEEEGLNQTAHKKIFIGKPTFDDFDTLMVKINEFKEIVEKEDREQIISKLEEIVPTYKRFELAINEVATSKCV